MRGLIRGASWAGVLLIATLAFLVSYHAIRDVWVEIGAGRPSDAWAVPLLLDGLIIVASLTALARSLDGLRTVYAWVLVGLSSLVSLAANIAHAAHHIGARLLAGMVPLVLLAAAELVVREVLRTRSHTLPHTASQPLTLASQAEGETGERWEGVHPDIGEDWYETGGDQPPALAPVGPATVSQPAFRTVQEAWEEIEVRGGQRLGHKRAARLTGESEWRARQQLAEYRAELAQSNGQVRG